MVLHLRGQYSRDRSPRAAADDDGGMATGALKGPPAALRGGGPTQGPRRRACLDTGLSMAVSHQRVCTGQYVLSTIQAVVSDPVWIASGGGPPSGNAQLALRRCRLASTVAKWRLCLIADSVS